MRTYFIEELLERYPVLSSTSKNIEKACYMLINCYENGGKLLIAGNGGSASDADHIVGELMKGFLLPRKIDTGLSCRLRKVDEKRGTELAEKLQGALPAIALHHHNSLNTALMNDICDNICYAQQVLGYGRKGDVLLAISTSGNSINVVDAAIMAKALNMSVIALTGKFGGKLIELADVLINVNEMETYKVQELHLPVYHCLCLMLEDYFFGNKK